MKAASNPSQPNAGLLQTYSAHGYEVLDIAVSADNSRFASVGGDRQVFLWDVAEGKTIRRFTGHAARVNAVAFAGTDDSIIVSGSYDASVRLWDCKSQNAKPIQVLDEARDSISALHVLEGGHEIITGSVDGYLRCYDLRMGQVHADCMGAPITSVQQTADAAAVLVSSLDGKIRLMDKRDGKMLKEYVGHKNEDYRVRSCLGLGDAVVLSGSEDGNIFAWDIASGGVIARVEGVHGGKVVSSVAWNGRKQEWASAGTDGRWNYLRFYVFDRANIVTRHSLDLGKAQGMNE